MSREEEPGVDLGQVEVVFRGPKAMKVMYEGEEVWIPYSQVHNDSELHEDDGDTDYGGLVITRWLAEQKDIDVD